MGSGRRKGFHFTDEAKHKLSVLHKGIHPSLETRRKMSLALKGNKNRKGKTGYHHSKETKEKMGRNISLLRKGKKLSEECKRKIGLANARRVWSEESKRKLRVASTDRVFSKERKQKISLAMIGKVLPEEQKQNIKIWRATYVMPLVDTKPEKMTQTILKSLKVPFKTHIPFWLNGKFHQVDVMLTNSPDIIEVEGCYWHQCERCGFKKGHNGLSAEQVRVQDRSRDNALRTKGFNVHRVWEHEMLDREQLTDRLQSIVNGNV